MKITYISNSSAPSKNASSLQTAKLCEGISKLGNKVNLILPDTGLKKNYFTFYNIRSRFKLTRLSFFKKFPKGINYYLYAFYSIYKSNFNKQDLFITRNFFASFILSLLNKKQILEIHDGIELEGKVVKFLIQHLKILNNRNIIKIITTTHSLKRLYVAKYKVEKDKIFVLHNASGLKSNYSKIKKNKKKLNVGYFGSLYFSRGLDMLIKLSKNDIHNNYFIYGGDKKNINDLKKKYNYKNLFFSEYIPYSKIQNKLKKVDVCILPYTNLVTVSGDVGDISKYTSPLKLFDYMKLGKLILCSNLKVLNEVLIHKKNCILINNYKNEKEWLKQIFKVSRNIKKYDNIRRSAFEYAKKHDVIWRTSKLLSFYDYSK